MSRNINKKSEKSNILTDMKTMSQCQKKNKKKYHKSQKMASFSYSKYIYFSLFFGFVTLHILFYFQLTHCFAFKEVTIYQHEDHHTMSCQSHKTCDLPLSRTLKEFIPLHFRFISVYFTLTFPY